MLFTGGVPVVDSPPAGGVAGAEEPGDSSLAGLVGVGPGGSLVLPSGGGVRAGSEGEGDGSPAGGEDEEALVVGGDAVTVLGWLSVATDGNAWEVSLVTWVTWVPVGLPGATAGWPCGAPAPAGRAGAGVGTVALAGAVV